MLESAIRTFLINKPAITALIPPSRIHVGDFVPLSKTDLPAIGIETDPQQREQNIDGTPVSMQFQEFDIVILSLQFTSAIQIGDLIAKAFRTIALGANLFTRPGTVNTINASPSIIGVGTAWSAANVGNALKLSDANGNLVYSGTITAVANAQAATVSPAPTSNASGLLWDLPSASMAVQISQVDHLGSWNEDEKDAGHALATKSRVVKIRVGWLEDTSTL